MVYGFVHPKMTHKSLQEQLVDHGCVAECLGVNEKIFILTKTKV